MKTGESRTYVAATHAHVGNPNDHIVLIDDVGQRPVLNLGIEWSVQKAREVLHFAVEDHVVRRRKLSHCI